MITNQPLVSVAIPCYNSSKTLPRALASLLAQTYTNWEAIVVDDGSTDNPLQIVELVHDDRIRYYRFDKNYGRAAARQQALDMARGVYLAMLDADDWVYPGKLEHQVEVMESHHDLTVLSAGMAIVDSANQIVAVRVSGNQSNKTAFSSQFSRPTMPYLAHAPAIIRMDVAKENPYDLRFTVAEDVDFLLRILLQNSFGILPDILYVYSEFDSYSIQKMARSSQANRRMFLKYKQRYLLAAYTELARSYTKEQIYRLSSFLHLDHYLVKRRSQAPTESQLVEFQRASEIVHQLARDIFVNTAYEIKLDSVLGSP